MQLRMIEFSFSDELQGSEGFVKGVKYVQINRRLSHPT